MSKRYLKSDKVFINGDFHKAIVEVTNDKITKILNYDCEIKIIEDYTGMMIIPGLIDIHNHGYAGWSFTGTATADDLVLLSKRLASLGITSCLCSASLNGYKSIVEAIETKKLATKFIGIHAEGPFLSSVLIGAAKPGTIFPDPNLDIVKKMVIEAKGYLKCLTIAPEKIKDMEVIDYLLENRVILAVGHTDASSKEFNSLKDKFALATHTGNTMRGIHHRDVGVLGAVLLDDSLSCEIIADGLHLCDEMLELIFRIKAKEKLIIVSDNTALAGLPSQKYQLADFNLTVTDNGLVVNEFGHLSGSSKSIVEMIRHLALKLNKNVSDAIIFVTKNPANLLGLDTKGEIKIGNDADLVVIDNDFAIKETISQGETIFKHNQELIKENPKLNLLLKDPEFMNFYQ